MAAATRRGIDPVTRLRAFVADYETQNAAAAELEISGAYLSDLLNARRACSDVILDRLGLERIVVAKRKS